MPGSAKPTPRSAIRADSGRCIAYGERRDFPPAIATGHEFVAEDSIPMGRWKEALTSADLDREIGQRIGSQDRMAWAEFSRTWALHVGGDLEASSAAARDG